LSDRVTKPPARISAPKLAAGLLHHKLQNQKKQGFRAISRRVRRSVCKIHSSCKTMSPRKTTVVSQTEPTAPSRESANDATTAPQQPPSRLTRIPSPVRFVLVVFSSLALSSALFTLASDITAGDLAPVSKHLETWWEVGGLVAWRAVELGLAWIWGFDGELLLYGL